MTLRIKKGEASEKCRAIREGLAGEKDLALIREHLRSCAECRKALRAESHLNRLVIQALRPQVDPGYWERIWPRIQVALVERSRQRQRPFRRWILAAAGALASAAALLILILTRPVSAPMFLQHDPSYFANLPSAPPAFIEKEAKDEAATELARISMGHATPTERVMTWQRLKGF